MNKNARRQFLKTGSKLILTFPLLNFTDLKITQNPRNRILLRAGWGNKSFGDLALIPAVIRSIQRFVPNTEVTIWPSEVDADMQDLLERNFTQLNLVSGRIDEGGEPDNEVLIEAFKNADIMLYVPGTHDVIDWEEKGEGIETASMTYSQKIGLPYVIYGLGKIPENLNGEGEMMKKINSAALSYITDPIAVEEIKSQKIKINNLIHGLDPIYAFDLKNESQAEDFLENAGLMDKEFIALVLANDQNPGVQKTGLNDKINILFGNLSQNMDHLFLLIPDSIEDIEFIKNIKINLPTAIQERTFTYDGVILPDILSSILEKSRIATGTKSYPLFSALVSGIPIFYFGDSIEDPAGESFAELGLKDYIANIKQAEGSQLYEILSGIDNSYVKALLDTNKAGDEVLKELERSYNNIYQLLIKINPEPKKKKRKDNSK